jgi:N-acetylmuramoyl-L-alanine amidase
MYRHGREQHDAGPRISGDQSCQTGHAGSTDQGNPWTVERAKHGTRLPRSRLVRALAVSTLISITTACVGPEEEVGATTDSTSGVVATTTTLVATTSTLSEETTSTTGFNELAAGALITPSGVVVAILDRANTGFIVRTPCDDTATIGNGEPVGPVSVVLDPGHGGSVDSGAVGANGLREADVNLTVASATERLLVERGISAILTRTGDYPVRIGVRAQLADDLGAEILVSIHHNAPTPGPSSTPGTEIFIQSDSERSRRLGGLIWEHVVDGIGGIEDVEWVAAPDVGVLRVLNPEGEDAYGMVRLPDTVAVLSELAYISNSSEAEMLATDEYVDIAAKSVADAIETYFEETDLGSGFVLEPRVFRPQRGISEDACEDPDLG